MPMHDWTRVGSFVFHAFHHGWLGGLCQALNASVLPAHLYALVEQPSLGSRPTRFCRTSRGGGERSWGNRSASKRPPGIASICQIRHNATVDAPKPVFWIASSRKDVMAFPKEVRQTVGQALFDAQTGGKHSDAKPLKGFKGAGVLEVVEDDDGSTYRAVYTVKFAGAVYVLHAFQKKSKRGSKTPAEEIEKVKARLKEAAKHHAQWLKEQEKKQAGDRNGHAGR